MKNLGIVDPEPTYRVELTRREIIAIAALSYNHEGGDDFPLGPGRIYNKMCDQFLFINGTDLELPDYPTKGIRKFDH